MTENKKELEQILNTEVNVSEDKIQFYNWRPSDDAALTETYAKFPLSHQDYLNLIDKAQFHKKIDKGEALGYFPFHWKTYSQVKLDWWDASADNPDDEAVKKSKNGDIVKVKYEDGFVYLVASHN